MHHKTDRELIELAAKSMGYKQIENRKGILFAVGHATKKSRKFNPLTSRVALLDLITHHKMGIHFADMEHNGAIHKVVEACYSHIDNVYQSEAVSYKVDPSEALARVVLLAAAKIGEGME